MADSFPRAASTSNGVQDHTNGTPSVVPSVQLGPGSSLINDPLPSQTTSHSLTPVYKVSAHAISQDSRGSFIDRGANGGILGNDARVILQHTREVDVTGIDNHQLPSLKLVDASAKAISPPIVDLSLSSFINMPITVSDVPSIPLDNSNGIRTRLKIAR